MAKKDLVSLDIVEIFENRDLYEPYALSSVPQVLVDGKMAERGVISEAELVDALLGREHAHHEHAAGEDKIVEKDLVIIGGGPGGLTAAIYAERAGLKTVVLEKGNLGGKVALTPVVENYPGFPSISGMALVAILAEHASGYAEIHENEPVEDIINDTALFYVRTKRALYMTKAVLLVTGAESKKLGAPGEDFYYGKGVSYCATCDGYFYKDAKKVYVIGGGNSAVTEAIHLKSLGADVAIIHRSGSLRAEKRLQESIEKEKIEVIYNAEVKEIRGEAKVKSILVKDMVSGTEKELTADGVFIAIGYEPNNALAKKLGLKLDEEGYIKVDIRMATSVRGIYAAGDITGGVKQIVVATSQGSIAALSAFEDIKTPYWVKKGKGGG